ncbi:hypothetical protein BDF14DRAFT_1847593 [Spinellus fusiger]|nr:hypothetical protein BDF14DRAFT_1847593 [Spinellus fusiger]
MASRLFQAVKTPVGQVIKRTYASHPTPPKQTAEIFPVEGYNSSLWRNTILAIVGAVVLYRVGEHVTDQGEEKHPLTRWIEYRMMTTSSEMDRKNTEFLSAAEEKTEYRLIYQEAQRAPIHRMRYPESFERASIRGLTAGGNADLSDLKIRTD